MSLIILWKNLLPSSCRRSASDRMLHVRRASSYGRAYVAKNDLNIFKLFRLYFRKTCLPTWARIVENRSHNCLSADAVTPPEGTEGGSFPPMGVRKDR